MKSRINLFLIVLFVPLIGFCQNHTEQYSQDKFIAEVNIKYVDIYTSTIIAVNCSVFDDFFKNEYKQVRLNGDLLVELHKILNESIEMDSTYIKSLDVRAKITDNDNNTDCVGASFFLMNNIVYKTSEELRKFIERLE
jgi:hypothetical protein